MKNNPLISVVIPVYNPGRHLKRCLDSIVGQTYRKLEIILIDDGSSDGSEAICDEYAAKDKRFVVIHQPNSGVSKARNAGLKIATGDLINFPDSDDYLDLDTYEYCLNKMKASGAEAICYEYCVTYESNELKHQASDGYYGVTDTQGAINELLFSNRTFLCTKILPMYAVKDIRFFEDIYRDEDTIFCMLALNNVGKTFWDDKVLYHYVQSEQSACRGVFRPNQLSAVKAIPIMENFLGKNYPVMLERWRANYMHLMIMLYCDMYFDKKNYGTEQSMIYKTFMELWNKNGMLNIRGEKIKLKFLIFRICPSFFCFIHRFSK